MAMKSGKPPWSAYDPTKQSKQPKGHSLGYGGAEDKHKPGQSYFAEQKEHWGSKAEGKNVKHTGEVAYTGPADRGGSELQEKTNSDENAKQPSGKSIGAGSVGGAEHHKNTSFGGKAHTFGGSAPNHMAHGYGHSIMQRKGTMRTSGHSGAHQVGKRGK